MDTQEIKLESPFETSGRKIEAVTVRSCKVGDLRMTIKRAEDLEDFPTFLKLTSHMTGLTPEELDNIDMRDWSKVTKAVNHFLGFAHQQAV